MCVRVHRYVHPVFFLHSRASVRWSNSVLRSGNSRSNGSADCGTTCHPAKIAETSTGAGRTEANVSSTRLGNGITRAPNFCSTTDIAFAPNGHLFISDGYANARILEYTPDGKKVREWRSRGTRPGQFYIPHSIQIDENNIIYVADRENGRIQRFDLQGKYLGEWAQYGKTFGLKLQKDALWLSTQPREEPNNSPGWLLKINRKTGKIIGYVESEGNHGIDVLANGELLQTPGPNQIPQRYQLVRQTP